MSSYAATLFCLLFVCLLDFNVGVEHLNSGLNASMSSTLPTEPFPQLLYFLWGSVSHVLCWAWTKCVAEDYYVKLPSPLRLLPECWDYRYKPPCPFYVLLRTELRTQGFLHTRQALYQLSYIPNIPTISSVRHKSLVSKHSTYLEVILVQKRSFVKFCANYICWTIEMVHSFLVLLINF